MKQHIALIWNQFDVYNRRWIKQNPDETPERFIERVKKWVIDFYEATPIDA